MERGTRIGIIGVGMVGAPLARYFIEIGGRKRGSDLFLYDIDEKKGYGDDVQEADVIFVCVPTPRTPDGSARISIVRDAVRNIGGEKIVVVKSTVPPGTTEALQKENLRHQMLFNPEFLTEARAWENTLHPDRQFVGCTEKSRDVAPRVLSLLPPAPLMSPSGDFDLSATEAELVKYAANLFLTRKVTFANAVYELAKVHGVNYENVKKGVASDRRIGSSHLDVDHGGYRGYGGYCFVKDTDALIAHSRAAGLHHVAALFEADRDFNTELLATQGLTPDDVSVHDHEWIQKKLKVKN